MIHSFKDLEVYQESYQLALLVHKLIKLLPYYEQNDLGFQMRKASKSCPANIAEGWARRRFEKEFKHHLDISLGSANEMETHLCFARDLKYLPEDVCNDLIKRYQQLGGKLVNLRNNWKTYQ